MPKEPPIRRSLGDRLDFVKQRNVAECNLQLICREEATGTICSPTELV